MATGDPIANLVPALATIANAFAQNQSGPNVPPSQMWSKFVSSVMSVSSSVSQASSSSANVNLPASNVRPSSSR